MTALPLLVAAAAFLATRLGDPLVAGALMPFVVTLLAAELDRESARFSLGLLRGARLLLPRAHRDEWHAQWVDHVLTAGERGVTPLFRALSIVLLGAPCLAVGLRVGASRRRRAT